MASNGAHISNRGVANFVGPVTQELLEAVTQTSPAVIMVSPGSRATGESWVNRINNEQLALPPVLLCIDYEWLESEELYEFAVTSCWWPIPPPTWKSV